MLEFNDVNGYDKGKHFDQRNVIFSLLKQKYANFFVFALQNRLHLQDILQMTLEGAEKCLISDTSLRKHVNVLYEIK